MNVHPFWLWTGIFIAAFAAIALACLLMVWFARPLIQHVFGKFITRLMSDRYSENVWEMVTAMTRINPIVVVENSLRAATGAIIERPFGSPRKFLNFDGLQFSAAQLSVLPTHEGVEIEMSVTIGPQARKPLKLNIPVLAGAMGYGIGVTETVKKAIARATAAVGTATNSGEGPYLPEEGELAKFYIWQYSSGPWSRNPEAFKRADAIEIHLGQGATAGTASIIPSEFIQGRASELMGTAGEDYIVIPGRHDEIEQGDDLRKLVERLREQGGGVPVGVKICASGRFEEDLEIIIQAGVDFISIDGGQAGTKGGAPILEDDFGLPTIFALTRAIRYLERRGVRDRISVLSGGGYTTPGHCLKALALGADAVFMGTALLWAMTHDQVSRTLPWEPPTELAFYPGKSTELLDEDISAEYLENFFVSVVEEMKLGIRALGKTSLSQVNKGDLVALDEWTGKVAEVPLANAAYTPGENGCAEAAIGSRNPEGAAEARSDSGQEQSPAEKTGQADRQSKSSGAELYASGAAAKQRSAGGSQQLDGSAGGGQGDSGDDKADNSASGNAGKNAGESSESKAGEAEEDSHPTSNKDENKDGGKAEQADTNTDKRMGGSRGQSKGHRSAADSGRKDGQGQGQGRTESRTEDHADSKEYARGPDREDPAKDQPTEGRSNRGSQGPGKQSKYSGGTRRQSSEKRNVSDNGRYTGRSEYKHEREEESPIIAGRRLSSIRLSVYRQPQERPSGRVYVEQRQQERIPAKQRVVDKQLPERRQAGRPQLHLQTRRLSNAETPRLAEEEEQEPFVTDVSEQTETSGGKRKKRTMRKPKKWHE